MRARRYEPGRRARAGRSRHARPGAAQETTRAARIIEQFIDSIGIGADVGLALCKRHWREVCGSLGDRSEPIKLEGTVLVVLVADSICYQELDMKKKTILAALKKRMPFGTKPTELRLRVDSSHFPSPAR